MRVVDEKAALAKHWMLKTFGGTGTKLQPSSQMRKIILTESGKVIARPKSHAGQKKTESSMNERETNTYKRAHQQNGESLEPSELNLMVARLDNPMRGTTPQPRRFERPIVNKTRQQ